MPTHKLGMRTTGNSGGNHNLILKASGGRPGESWDELDFAGLPPPIPQFQPFPPAW